MKKICASSETYLLLKKDLFDLKEKVVPKLPQNEIAILLGNEENGENDFLIAGADILNKSKTQYVPVRLYFHPSVSPLNLPYILCKKLRYGKKRTNAHTYHIKPQTIRDMGIERTIKTRENAYNLRNKLYARPEAERLKQYDKLEKSLVNNGCRDPLLVMLCRRMGIQDTLDNGHHRMSICIKHNIEPVPVKFVYMSRLHAFFEPIFRFFGNISLFKKD